ncbi:unnamed protein product [Ambrosiozyma monospora]|uniref:Unnamed protein product n=1 Tax=Ambrosiozyma monospora TaxID=43982 RepID=A0ACB5UBH0_AMBMO|nr:unnamed protein product [Ambrosiozyma monospora]
MRTTIGTHDYGWGIVISFTKRKSRNQAQFSDHESYIVQVFVNTMYVDSPVNLIKPMNPNLVDGIRPAKKGEKARSEVIPITLDSVKSISSCRSILPNDINNKQARKTLNKALKEIIKRFPDGIPLLDPINKMHIEDDQFKLLLRKIEILESKLYSNPLSQSPRLTELYQAYAKKVAIQENIKATEQKVTEVQSVIQLDDLKRRTRVLKRLGFISENEVVELKGKVACEIMLL